MGRGVGRGAARGFGREWSFDVVTRASTGVGGEEQGEVERTCGTVELRRWGGEERARG